MIFSAGSEQPTFYSPPLFVQVYSCHVLPTIGGLPQSREFRQLAQPEQPYDLARSVDDRQKRFCRLLHQLQGVTETRAWSQRRRSARDGTGGGLRGQLRCGPLQFLTAGDAMKVQLLVDKGKNSLVVFRKRPGNFPHSQGDRQCLEAGNHGLSDAQVLGCLADLGVGKFLLLPKKRRWL